MHTDRQTDTLIAILGNHNKLRYSRYYVGGVHSGKRKAMGLGVYVCLSVCLCVSDVNAATSPAATEASLQRRAHVIPPPYCLVLATF